MRRAELGRILLLIPHLGGGGAEQVMAQVARGVAGDQQYEVHLATVTGQGNAAQMLQKPVIMHTLGARRVRSSALRLLRLVWKLRPEVILSGMAHLNFLVLLMRPFFPQGTCVLVRQNGSASATLEFGDLPRSTRIFYQFLYHYADRVVCQTQSMAEDLARNFGVPEKLLTVLPNPIDMQEIRTRAAQGESLWTGAGPHLLAVGRLAPVKGFDRLLRALKTVREEFPQADLTIAGAGPEEAALRALIRALGVEEAVRMLGQIEHPANYYAGATLFVLSSLHEGLPNALLEAAAGGLPLVSSPASGGVVELLRNRPGVWLAEDCSAEALAAALLKALRELEAGARFSHEFVEPFDFERAIGAYRALIEEERAKR